MRLDDFGDYEKTGGRLPYFRDAYECLGAALDALAPPERAPVSEVARRRKVNVGGYWRDFDPDFAPYMREPCDLLASRRFRELVFVGPARSLKTQSLVVNGVTHAILARPTVAHLVFPTQTVAQNFSEEELGPTIRNSPALVERLKRDNVFAKTFGGGARVTLGWPVAAQLRARTIGLVLLSDYDAFPDSVDGEGSAFALGAKRAETAASAGMTVAESSPGRPILDEDFEPSTPHEAPPALGVLGLYNGGSRARLYWPCLDCGELYAPSFERLRYDATADPAEAGESAEMVCPECGSLAAARHRAELMRKAVWRHESREGGLCAVDGPVRNLPRASYWLDGTAAAFATWSDLVRRYESARRHADATGDEEALRTTVNVDQGAPFVSRAKSTAQGLTPAALRALGTAEPVGVCPADTAFVVVTVDVQGGAGAPGWFAVQAEAWRPGLARTLVERFNIATPPAGAPKGRDGMLDPARFSEHWRALDYLFSASWPVAGGTHRLRAVAIGCDAGGAPGVTANAYEYFRRMRREHGKRFRLVRGNAGARAPRAIERAPETVQNKRRRVARDVRIIFAHTDRLKDELLASLLREEDGPRAYRIPRGIADDVVAEFCAERHDGDGWKPKPGVRRNESWDLAVYSAALAIVLGAERVDWSRPPAWAEVGPGNAWAAPEAQTGTAKAPAAQTESENATASQKTRDPVAAMIRARRRGRSRGF
jgi:phage terminase large subunit GpA-like protein